MKSILVAHFKLKGILPRYCIVVTEISIILTVDNGHLIQTTAVKLLVM